MWYSFLRCTLYQEGGEKNAFVGDGDGSREAQTST